MDSVVEKSKGLGAMEQEEIYNTNCTVGRHFKKLWEKGEFEKAT